MLTFALMHIAMIPITLILQAFPALKPIAEAPLEFILMLSEWF